MTLVSLLAASHPTDIIVIISGTPTDISVISVTLVSFLAAVCQFCDRYQNSSLMKLMTLFVVMNGCICGSGDTAMNCHSHVIVMS